MMRVLPNRDPRESRPALRKNNSSELHQSRPPLRKNNSSSLGGSTSNNNNKKKGGRIRVSLMTFVSGCLLLFFVIGTLGFLFYYGNKTARVLEEKEQATRKQVSAPSYMSPTSMSPKSLSSVLQGFKQQANPTCAFRQYPPKRYYGLTDSKWPDFLETADYIFGERPQLLQQGQVQSAQESGSVKLCVDQSEWHTQEATILPFADGTNPSILRLHNNPRLEDSITNMFPKEAKYLATICMTNSQCAWMDSPQEIQDYHLSTQEDPTTERTVLLVLDQHFRTLAEATMYLHVDAKYGRVSRPKYGRVRRPAGKNIPIKAMALDDARLFTNHGQIWVSYREGPNFGYEKQVLNPVHFQYNDNNGQQPQLEVTLKASETTTFSGGRNMALIDNVETNQLQSLTWADPITVINVDDGVSRGINPPQQSRRLERKTETKKRSDFHGTSGSLLYLPHTKEYLGIGHFHRPPGREENEYARFGHHYTHAFFTIPSQPPFYLKRLSPEFVVPSHAKKEDAEIIQFLSGLELVDDSTIVITYGINDCEGAAIHVKLDQVDAMLRDVPKGKEVVDMMEPLPSAL